MGITRMKVCKDAGGRGNGNHLALMNEDYMRCSGLNGFFG